MHGSEVQGQGIMGGDGFAGRVLRWHWNHHRAGDKDAAVSSAVSFQGDKLQPWLVSSPLPPIGCTSERLWGLTSTS